MQNERGDIDRCFRRRLGPALSLCDPLDHSVRRKIVTHRPTLLALQSLAPSECSKTEGHDRVSFQMQTHLPSSRHRSRGCRKITVSHATRSHATRFRVGGSQGERKRLRAEIGVVDAAGGERYFELQKYDIKDQSRLAAYRRSYLPHRLSWLGSGYCPSWNVPSLP